MAIVENHEKENIWYIAFPVNDFNSYTNNKWTLEIRRLKSASELKTEPWLKYK
jgi:hypothetical protein